MLDFNLQFIRCVRHEGRWLEGYSLGRDAVHVFLNLQGLRFLRLLNRELKAPGCFLAIQPPETRIDFSYDTSREDWVAILNASAIRAGSGTGMVEFHWGGVWLEVPAFVPLSKAQGGYWRGEFLKARDCLREPLPQNRLWAKLAVCNVLREFIRPAAGAPDSPAMRLKQQIDEGALISRTLEDLSGEYDYSLDHLRLLFFRKYGLNPLDYWQQVR